MKILIFSNTYKLILFFAHNFLMCSFCFFMSQIGVVFQAESTCLLLCLLIFDKLIQV